MFLGQYQHSIDDKGRLMIPARFREALEGGAYLTQGFDKCLMVMTEAYFQQVYERVDAMNLMDPTARLLRRMLLANAYPVEVDKVGRVLVPANLRQFAVLEGNAVIAGQGGYFEVWSPAEWEKQTVEINDIEANNQRFATLNLSTKP
ncbi:MAG: transcriptional regulator MraZ [Anaerolineaceae bacterium]|nr:division/cell wall cluster transcriptional repressor MraZ [Anaerolineae bacterium]MBL1171230.1 division/cell wall cluster transcriptional repressor MraZ [Chloroflexota bacterium]MCL4823798.1 division/cell wall cluster transcriptional repressor MraZ [Anaerolineales bacterium]MDL1925523.1 division/cell wall cluster transcriptional repressor MraZ [Anaerolineae bacterium AMX1]GJQ38469.1 MAG: transcriptional regulator MraZ [Anaerolineaceae bacterium]